MSKCSICNEPQFESLLGMNCQNGHLNAPAQENVTLSGTQTHDNKPVTDEETPHIIPLDKLVKIYVKMRDKLGEEKKAYEVIEKDLKEQMAQVATELKSRAIQQGVEGFKTDFGTVYLYESMKVSCGDWSAFSEFLKDHDPLEFMEKRISSTAVKEYMKHTDGQLPPGVSIFKEIEARVRRAGEK